MNKLIRIYESATNGSRNVAGLSVRVRFSFIFSLMSDSLMSDSPQFHRGVAAPSRMEISRDTKLSSQLEHTSKQSSSPLSFHWLPPLSPPVVRQTDEMWRDSPDKTSGPYLIWFWLKVRFQDACDVQSQKKSDTFSFQVRTNPYLQS